MTSGRVARRVTSSWPRRSCRMSKAPDNPRKALGRGLTSLLVSRTAPKPEPAPQPAAHAALPSEVISRIPLDLVDPNPLQPRTAFQPDRLQELADSIRANGIIQP